MHAKYCWTLPREVARLLVQDRGIFEFPLTATNREQEDWEVEGLHHEFLDVDAFEHAKDGGRREYYRDVDEFIDSHVFKFVHFRQFLHH